MRTAMLSMLAVAATTGVVELATIETAYAQVAPKNKPVIRTPRVRPGLPSAGGASGAGTGAPGAGGPGANPTNPTDPNAGGAAGGGAAGGGAAGNGAPAKDPNDPMSGLSTPRDIDFHPKSPGSLVTLNLQDADLPDLVKAVSEMTGRRFIFGSKLHSFKATVYAPEKVTAAEAYSAFLAILEQNGMTVIPHGSFMKIVESQDSTRLTTPIYGTASPVPAEDRYITRLYRLTNVDSSEAKTLLDNFKTKDANITTYAAGNLLIITETGSNIRRLLRIVEEIDVGSAGDQIWVQPVYNSSAADAAQKLNDILGGGTKGANGKTSGGVVVPDERTNSLIITASKGDYDKILELIKRVVDAPAVEGDTQIHVLPLQHAVCSELQQSLNQILGGGGAAAPRPRTGTTGRTAGAAAGGAVGGGGAVSGGGDEVFEGQVKVGCDEATNSLLTTSSLRDYAALRGVIDRLDQPRRQVFIEAVIMDLSVSRTTDLGIGYHGGAPLDDNGTFFFGGENPAQSALAGVPARLDALALGVRGPELEGSQALSATGLSIPALGIVLHAAEVEGSSNILATPHILTTDNVTAHIDVGQSVPLQTNAGGSLGALAQAAGGAGAGALGGLGGLGGLLGGFQAPYRDVGVKLEIKPHINDSDQVRLELKEEFSEVGASNQGALGAATINQRMAETTLIVKDQQTVVIGGLMRDQDTVAETKIPILGDIPVLGALFRQQVKTKVKSNLVLILTPFVIRDQSDLRAIFERKMQERQEFLDRYFVFSDQSAWRPPSDFSRSNGLVETIRQSMLATHEKERLENEARGHGPKSHDPVDPIALPSTYSPKAGAGAAGAGGGGGSAGSSGMPQTGGTTNPTTIPNPNTGPRGRIRNGPGGTNPPQPQRVE